MGHLIPALLLALSCAYITGCASSSGKATSSYSPAKATSVSKNKGRLYQAFNRQYKNWYGTPYELGGMDRNGIDCSGFVHIAYRDAVGMRVPRSTEQLAKTGTTISKKQLNVGDLVFFKTGIFKRHVGIYIGNQQFIHASTSKGVMKSNLGNPYWRQHYWKSVRLLSN